MRFNLLTHISNNFTNVVIISWCITTDSTRMAALRLLLVVASFITVWCADPKVVIRQTFPETKIVDGHKTIVVEKDKDCFLACVVDNRPALSKVQWIIQNYAAQKDISISTDTDTTDSFRYQIDKPAANNWRLKIQNVQESDQALYICRVQLGGQKSANDSRMISVIQKPQIIDIYTSSDTTAEENERVELRCQASGIPKPLIIWRRAGDSVLPTGGRELADSFLLIEQVRREHKGRYECIAQNIAGVDKRLIKLNVEFAPQVSPVENEVFQATGYPRSLNCIATGNPVPTDDDLVWYRDGQPLANPSRYVFKNYIGSQYVLMKMIINDIQDSDFGKYGCYADNSEGKGNSFVRLSQSSSYVSERKYSTGGATLLTFSLTTIAMLVATSLLHFC